ncbi:MAG: aromatic ring-hydroxylating dioxygenase subunit alpha [Phycisphaerales bacterium]|nr:MAG: aromatic ring-hydroxylating dioxygenase subunit alpha [Phycisphaerales bacterium]
MNPQRPVHGEPFQIDADIRRAHTLPSWVYTDPEVFERSRESVFAPSWQLVAGLESVSLPGSARPLTVLEGLLDEPIVVTRDERDTLRCLSNVCTHRGNLVCTQAGRCAQLRCNYHGRRFALDGSFRSMPEFEETEDFPSPDDDLRPVPCEALGAWLFASLKPATAFNELAAPVIDRVGFLDMRQMRHEPTRSRDYLVKCNWALYVENYLEGFHVPFVHDSLAQALDYGSYTTELFKSAVLQLGIAKGAEDCFEIPEGHPDAGRSVAAYYWWLWPNTMLNFYPWGCSVNIVRPLGPALTKVSFLTYVSDESRLDKGAGAELDKVEREDEAVVEQVQRGVRSRIYSRGRYSPTREQGVHHFHRTLAEALFPVR